MHASVQVPVSQHLSHSAAHRSQASAQAAAIVAVNGPPRPQISAHVAQIEAQSMQVLAQGIIPFGLRQSATQVLHATEHAEQTLAHAVSFFTIDAPACLCFSSARATTPIAPMAAVVAPSAVIISRRFMTHSFPVGKIGCSRFTSEIGGR
jgi:hypothetical protein